MSIANKEADITKPVFQYRQTLSIIPLVLAGVFVFFTGLGFATTTQSLQSNESLIYPLREISTLEGRQQMTHRNELDEKYKIQLPRIKNANYDAYKNNDEYLSIYTTLRGDTYLGKGREQEIGDHEGVDIATARGTPVYAIANGIVTFAGTQAGYGKVVKLMFSYRGETLHAVFAHLDEIRVTKGQIVSQGKKIGSVGNTGNTFGALGGYHLNLEINRDSHGYPLYALYNCPALETNSRDDIVNKGLCKNYRIANSYDPIVIIEQGRDRSKPETNKDQNKLERPVQDPRPSQDGDKKPQEDTTKKPTQDTNTIHTPPHSKKFLELKDIPNYKLSPQAIQFFRERDLQIISNTPQRVEIGQSGLLSFYITKKGEPYRTFKGVLPVQITLISPNGKISLESHTIGYIQDKQVDIKYKAREYGASTISIDLDGQSLAVLPLTIQ